MAAKLHHRRASIALCPAQRRRTPSVVFAATATAAAARRPPQRCTTPQALLSAAPHPEVTHRTTACTPADVEATRHLDQSEASAAQTFRLVDPLQRVGPKRPSSCVLVVWGEGAELLQSLTPPQRHAQRLLKTRGLNTSSLPSNLASVSCSLIRAASPSGGRGRLKPLPHMTVKHPPPALAPSRPEIKTSQLP